MFRFNCYNSIPKNWDNFNDINNGLFTTSSQWPKVYENLGIGKGRYIRVYNKKNEVICQCLIYENILGSNIILKYLPKLFLKILLHIPIFVTFSSHMSPVINKDLSLNDEEIKELIIQLCKYLYNLVLTENKNIGPFNLIFTKNINLAKEICNECNKIGLNSKIVGTVRLKLEKNIEEMFKKIGSKRRNIIKKAKKNSLFLKIKNKNTIDDFYNHLIESWKNYGLAVPSKKYYDELFKNKNVLLFNAYKDNYLLASNGLMVNKNIALEFSMNTTKYEREKRLRGGDFLKWEEFKYCIEHDIEYIDFNMIDLSESTEKTKRINFFKLSWGNEIYYGIEIKKFNRLAKLLRKIKLIILGK